MSVSFKRQFVLALAFSIVAGLDCAAQNKNKSWVQKLLAEVAEHEKAVAECERKSRVQQMAQFGRILPKISGFCFEGCPVSLPRPYYPALAKRLRIAGRVVIETIADEEGKIIYARALSGNPLLISTSLQAAYGSRFKHQLICGQPVKFRWRIAYNFVLT